MYQYAADHNAVFTAPSWSVRWRDDFGGQINGGLSIVGTTLFVESFDMRITAIDAFTGKLLWQQPLSNVAMNTPIVANGLVVAGGGSGNPIGRWLPGNPFFSMSRPDGDSIYAFDSASGKLVWRTDTFGENMPTGVLFVGARPAFIFSNGDEHAYSLNFSDGRTLWKVKTFGEDAMSSLAEDEGVVFGSTGYRNNDPNVIKAYADRSETEMDHTGATWAMRGRDGTVVWSQHYGHGLGSPTLADGSVFAESDVPSTFDSPRRIDDHLLPHLNEVAALDEKTGAFRWRYLSDPGTFVKVSSGLEDAAGTYADGILYQALPYPKEFAAFDGANGRVIWKIATHDQVKMSAIVSGGHVVFGDVDGYLYIVRASDGKIERSLKFPSFFTCSPPLLVGNTFFVANGTSLYALKFDALLQGEFPS